jgi:hypothetical protein
MCELEGVAQKSAVSFFTEFGEAVDRGDVDFRMIRVTMWAALLDSKPDITLDGAGRIADAAGLQNAIEAVSRAVKAFFPQAEVADASAKADPENP